MNGTDLYEMCLTKKLRNSLAACFFMCVVWMQYLCVEVIVATIVLIFDGKAEDVASPEAGAVVHASVEQRMGVGILNVQDLTCGCHVACNTLICWDTKLLLHSHTKQTQTHTQLLISSGDINYNYVLCHFCFYLMVDTRDREKMWGGADTKISLSVWRSYIGGVGAFNLPIPRCPFSHNPSVHATIVPNQGASWWVVRL